MLPDQATVTSGHRGRCRAGRDSGRARGSASCLAHTHSHRLPPAPTGRRRPNRPSSLSHPRDGGRRSQRALTEPVDARTTRVIMRSRAIESPRSYVWRSLLLAPLATPGRRSTWHWAPRRRTGRGASTGMEASLRSAAQRATAPLRSAHAAGGRSRSKTQNYFPACWLRTVVDDKRR